MAAVMVGSLTFNGSPLDELSPAATIGHTGAFGKAKLVAGQLTSWATRRAVKQSKSLEILLKP